MPLTWRDEATKGKEYSCDAAAAHGATDQERDSAVIGISNIFPHKQHRKILGCPPNFIGGHPERKIISGGPTMDHDQLICKFTVLLIHSYNQEVTDKTHTETGHGTDIYQILFSPGCKQRQWFWFTVSSYSHRRQICSSTRSSRKRSHHQQQLYAATT